MKIFGRFRKPKYKCAFCEREAILYNDRTNLGYPAFMCAEDFKRFGVKETAILIEDFKLDR